MGNSPLKRKTSPGAEGLCAGRRGLRMLELTDMFAMFARISLECRLGLSGLLCVL